MRPGCLANLDAHYVEIEVLTHLDKGPAGNNFAFDPAF